MSGPVATDTRYRIADENRDLARVYKGMELVGTVRRSLDNRWYPELPAEATRTAAIRQLLLAHEAMTEFRP